MKALKFAAVYLVLACSANAQTAPAELPREGDMRKLNVHAAPQGVSEATFEDAGGETHRLADWQGKHVLVNFWATWCAPCREEMPSLSALQSELGGEAFEVVTIATGRNTVEGIERFFDEVGVENLPVFIDDGTVARDMAVLGLPITVILDPEGREIARLQGDADWNGAAAQALVTALVGADGQG